MTELEDLARFREHTPPPGPDAADRVIARLRAEAERPKRPLLPARRPRRLGLVPALTGLAAAAFLVVALWPGNESDPRQDILARAAAAIAPKDGILHVSWRETTIETVVDASTGRRVRGPLVSRWRGDSWHVERPTPAWRERTSDKRGRFDDVGYVVDADDPDRMTVTSFHVRGDGRVVIDVNRHQPTGDLARNPVDQIRDDLDEGNLRLAGRTRDGSLRLRGGDYELHVDPHTYEPRRQISEYSGPFPDPGLKHLPIGAGEEGREVVTTEFAVEHLPDTPRTRKLLRIVPPRKADS